MADAVKCPKCGESIEISEALSHQIQEQVVAELEHKHEIKIKETEIKAQAQAEKKFASQMAEDIKRAKEEAEENRIRNKELVEQLTEMTRQLRLEKTRADDARLEMEKKLSQEEDKIRQDATQKAQEEQHLKLLEKDKQLQDAIKANEELRRKLQQGSQQTQGEVLELEFESQLQKEFPNDKVLPVGKGIRGGDIIHEIWDANGNYTGKILWEFKQAKAWSEGWIDKLRADQREVHAEMAIIVSEIMPQGVNISGYRNGVWVTERKFALCIAAALRANVIQAHYIRQSVKGKNEKMEILYSYLSGTDFKHRVEAIIEAFTNMQDEIEKEKRYFQLKWARDEKNIRYVIDNTFGMHGDLKAIVGTALPQIKGIEDEELLDSQAN